MKKILLCCLLLSFLMPLQAEKPKRYGEFGFDVNAGAANNFLGLSDVFNAERTIVLDPGKMPGDGFWLNTSAETRFFLNVNMGEKYSLGLFMGVDVAVYGNLSSELFKFLSEGNENMRDFTGTAAAGGSVFVDAGIKTRAQFGKLIIGLTPAVYVPVVYIPPPVIRYHLDSGEHPKADVTVDVNAYTPISIEGVSGFTGSSSDNNDSGSSGFTTADIWNALDARGFDFSLDVEYLFLPKLDLGGSITNIPLVPAVLRRHMNYHFNYEIDPFTDSDTGEIRDWRDFFDNGFDIKNPEMEDPVFADDASFSVFRPLRFDFYALYRPFTVKWLVLKPHIGFSALTIYGYDVDGMCFNAGLEARLNLKRIFSVSLGTDFREKLWRHSLGLMLNLRVLELNLGVNLQSQDFVGSFSLEGAGVFLGLRIGF
jgi:hypothetical protein